jgi:hypothetical protein
MSVEIEQSIRAYAETELLLASPVSADEARSRTATKRPDLLTQDRSRREARTIGARRRRALVVMVPVAAVLLTAVVYVRWDNRPAQLHTTAPPTQPSTAVPESTVPRPGGVPNPDVEVLQAALRHMPPQLQNDPCVPMSSGRANYHLADGSDIGTPALAADLRAERLDAAGIARYK